MKRVTFFSNAAVGSVLIATSFVFDHLGAEGYSKGMHYVTVTLPLLLSFIPIVISVGGLYMSAFFYGLVRDEESRKYIKQRIGFFIIEK